MAVKDHVMPVPRAKLTSFVWISGARRQTPCSRVAAATPRWSCPETAAVDQHANSIIRWRKHKLQIGQFDARPGTPERRHLRGTECKNPRLLPVLDQVLEAAVCQGKRQVRTLAADPMWRCYSRLTGWRWKPKLELETR